MNAMTWFKIAAAVAVVACQTVTRGDEAPPQGSSAAEAPAKTQSALSRLAASMPNRSWRTLATKGLEKLRLYGRKSACVTFAQDLVYEEKSKKILFIGVGHGGDNPNFLIYDLASNRWADSASGDLPWPKTGRVSHAYDMSTVNIDRRTFCHIYRGHFLEYDPATGKWTGKPEFVPTDTDRFYTGPGGAVEYFPPRKTFVLFNYRRGSCLAILDPPTGKWRMISGFDMPPDIHNLMVYNTVTKRLYFGGGNNTKAFYEMDAEEKVVRLPDAPETYRSVTCNLLHDPLTGDILLLNYKSRRLHSFDVKKRRWSLVSSAPVVADPPGIKRSRRARLRTALACEVPDHGVMFFVSHAVGRNPVVYLYKHGPPGLGVGSQGVSMFGGSPPDSQCGESETGVRTQA